ncbi:MAG TPA: DEAD/DEAH box helicase [Phycisphaerae bacterium]|nr:DEAD/DEAH box helicase [Phycisphaerae bacterium]HNU44703.1 DEAD/DEAH box helicase [Phycisphaerae bacterium]
MIRLHAVWKDASLHIWGELAPATGVGLQAVGNEHVGTRGTVGPLPDSTADGAASEAGASGGLHVGRGGPTLPAQPATTAAASEQLQVLPEDELRACLGELADGLLVSGARGGSLRLTLPHRAGVPLSSFAPELSAATSLDQQQQAAEVTGQPVTVPVLRLSPADAMDFLTDWPTRAAHGMEAGGSLRYWSCVARLVLELLARQRFVPDLHHVHGNNYQAFWRVVVDGAETADRIGRLITAMPPVCVAGPGTEPPPQVPLVLENFLWTTADAVIRRCLEGDDLAHALRDRGGDAACGKVGWLRALLGPESRLTGPASQCAEVWQSVRGWLAALEPPDLLRTCRTCFRLHPSPAEDETPTGAIDARAWLLTVHVQATADEDVVIDVAELWREQPRQPAILPRPFDGARAFVREDLARAARHFEPLAAALEQPQPGVLPLTLEEAYRFLRDAAVVLELEGFGVWLPEWWRRERSRLGVRLDVRPAGEDAAPAQRVSFDALVSYDWRLALGDEDISLEEITALAQQKAPLVRWRGRWTELHPAEVEAAAEFVQRSPSGRMTLREALQQAFLRDETAAGLRVVGMRTSGWVHQLLHATQTDRHLESVPAPAGFHGQLRSYQLTGLAWLAFLAEHGLGACLADDMGLGKTIQTIALWLHERHSGQRPGPTLLVVPMSLVGNWRREINRFAPSLRVLVHHGLDRLSGEQLRTQATEYDVVISTYGLIHRDFEHLASVAWHRVVLDEAQNIKNPAAKQAQAIRALPTGQRVALTGTPLENHLTELWSILDFLNPGFLGSASDFRRRFAVPIERHHDSDRADRLRRLIQPFVLRRLKRDPDIMQDLPERLEMKVFCNLTQEQAALYEAVVADMLGQIEESGGMQRRGLILAALVKLKQICNHPAHFLREQVPGAAEARHGPVLHQRSGKCERLREMIEEVVAEGDAALVFTQFRQMGALLQHYLGEAFDREVLFLHGGTSAGQRDALVHRFQQRRGDTPVFVLSLKAGGVGLNLTAANHVFHFDRWWNPAVEEQATDRAHRIGQQRMVQVHKLICLGTLEERIDGMLEQKKDLAERIVGAGEEWLTELSTEALRDLLTLSREAVGED